MRNYRSTPEVNSGSMADIAFLLLIFFLVATTISNDKGIVRKLPEKCPTNTDCSVLVGEQNILTIYLGQKGDLLVNQEVLLIDELKDKVIAFLDNNGDLTCDYCNGAGDIASSDNPKKAVVSLHSDRLVPYVTYIAVQDELTAAYYELREGFVINELGKGVARLQADDLQLVMEAYPLKISEAEIKQR